MKVASSDITLTMRAVNFCVFTLTGIFAPMSKITVPGSLLTSPSRTSLQRLNHGKIEVSHITAKVDTG
jgi:hypothetical protein